MKQTEAQLSVIARAPFNVYYEGQADTVSATNKVGRFDILPGHADFFSVLSADEVTIEPGGNAEPVTFSISNGIITVRDNEVLLFVNM
jgi:F0F1-type ATP synthase epsilon subunit